MKTKFSHHYTREEAKALMPQLREWLEEIRELQKQMVRYESQLDTLIGNGDDAGGRSVNENVRAVARLQQLSREFDEREIFIKDTERGLVDFPAIVGGREVFLCWESDEDDIEFWHDIDSGFAGRERL